jgi:hypothetical protein
LAPKRVIIPRFPLSDEEALKASEKKNYLSLLRRKGLWLEVLEFQGEVWIRILECDQKETMKSSKSDERLLLEAAGMPGLNREGFILPGGKKFELVEEVGLQEKGGLKSSWGTLNRVARECMS